MCASRGGYIVDCSKDDIDSFMNVYYDTINQMIIRLHRVVNINHIHIQTAIIELDEEFRNDLNIDKSLLFAAMEHSKLTGKEVHVLSEDNDVRQLATLIHKMHLAA